MGCHLPVPELILSFLDEHMERVVEPGEFRIMVGTSSKEFETAMLQVVGR